VILLDSSAWIEYLRRTGSTTNRRVVELIHGEADLVTTDAVVMEVLAGARHPAHRESLGRLLRRFRFEPIEGPGDYEAAADVYAACRRAGETVRSPIDCLIACVAMRAGLELLHSDGHFDAIARHAPLKLVQ
jgi:predicted nucleic acid-binding protein